MPIAANRLSSTCYTSGPQGPQMRRYARRDKPWCSGSSEASWWRQPSTPRYTQDVYWTASEDFPMHIAIDLPDDIVATLQATCPDMTRLVMESLALEGYRSRQLS